MIGQIGVMFVIALMRMMLQMINAKAHRARRQIWKIGQDRDQLVQTLVSQDEIMGRVVNDDVVGVIGESADAIGNQQTEPPITESQLPIQNAIDVCKTTIESAINAVYGFLTINCRTSGCALMMARARPGCG